MRSDTMARRPLLITGARVLDPGGELHRPPVADILVQDGRIAAVGGEAAARSDAEIFDAGGLLVVPGFVNAHCHSHDTLLRGLFEELPLELWGQTAFPFHWSPRSTEEVSVRTLLHGAECLRSGITTLQDMVTIVDFDLDHARAVASAYARLGIDAIVAPQFSDLAPAAGIPFADAAFSPRLQSVLGRAPDAASIRRGVLAILDEPAGEGVSWALGPVQPQLCSDDLLAWVSSLAAERDLRIFTHLYETRTEAVLARKTLASDDGSMVRRLSRVGLAGPRLTIAHGVWITRPEIAELAARGVSLASNPVTNLKLLNGVAPVARYAEAGVTIGLGCDNSSANDVQSPFQAMKLFALAWALQSGVAADGAAAQAFRAATTGSARALGLEGEVGRVAPGFRANLVFIDLADPSWRPLNSAVRQLVYGETGRAVRHVMVGGRMVVRDGAVTTLDETVLCKAAEHIRSAMEGELTERLALDPEIVEGYRSVYRRVDATPIDIDPRHLCAELSPPRS
jgi:5-methylthioadenosine/S-adenosylhomocysteine deaminase